MKMKIMLMYFNWNNTLYIVPQSNKGIKLSKNFKS